MNTKKKKERKMNTKNRKKEKSRIKFKRKITLNITLMCLRMNNSKPNK